MIDFDLFPYSFFWRMGSEPEHNNRCGLIASIFIFLALSYLLFDGFITVFKMDSITASSTIYADKIPPSTEISTHLSSNAYVPFMIAYNLTDIQTQSNPIAISAKMIYVSQNLNGSENQREELFLFESCSVDHFQGLAEAQESFNKLQMNLWACLPLNRSFTLQGSELWRQKYSTLHLEFQCKSSCQTGIQIYTLNTQVNPTMATDPHQSYIEAVSISLQPNTARVYAYEVIQNVYSLDQSIFPWSSVLTTHSFMTNNFEPRVSSLRNSSLVRVAFQRSHQTYIHQATYAKLLDILSYVGGMFQTLVGLFFFTNALGRIFFEFNFAKLYFRRDLIKGFGFPGYLKQIIFNILDFFNISVKWEEARRRQKVRETVNKLLDVVELFKRLDFLQNAVTNLLTTPELKSILLMGRKGREEVDQNAKRLAFRDRIIVFIAKKRNLFEKYEKAEVQQKQPKDQKKTKQSKKAENLNLMKQGRHKKELMTDLKRTDYDGLIGSATNLNRVEMEMMMTAEMIKKTPSIRIMGSQRSRSEEAPVEGQIRIYPCQLEKSDEEQLYLAARAIGPMPEEVLDAEELTFWFRYQYREFVERAAESDRCRRVKGFVEGWLLRVMEETAMELQKEPRLSCGKEIVLTPVVEKTFNEIVLEPVEEVPEEEDMREI